MNTNHIRPGAVVVEAALRDDVDPEWTVIPVAEVGACGHLNTICPECAELWATDYFVRVRDGVGTYDLEGWGERDRRAELRAELTAMVRQELAPEELALVEEMIGGEFGGTYDHIGEVITTAREELLEREMKARGEA